METSEDNQISQCIDDVQPLWKWIVAVIFLAMAGLTTGSVNLYPSQRDSIILALDISDSLGTFMLTGGVMIMYITLPAGLFMDHFGGNVTLLISAIITIISYFYLSFFSKPTWLFITFYLLMAFGSSSLFIVCLQIVFSRAPLKIKGASASIVGASLSLSFGLFLEIYKAGSDAFNCETYSSCVFASFRLVGIVVISMVTVSCPLAYFFYRGFPASGNQPSTRVWSLFCDFRLYSLLFLMLVTVFDGMIVLEGGDHIWKSYGKGYPFGASDWGIVFSVINCVSTILISFLIDFLIHKFEYTRMRIFGSIFIAFAVIPLILTFLFRFTDNEKLFGFFLSLLGMLFGLGLTQIPTLVSDVFGNDKYGFAFGIVQFGSIFSSASAMPIILRLEKSGIMITFLVFAGCHIALGLITIFLKKNDSYTNLD